MASPVSGSCLCGAVTFEIAPPYRWFAHCHCSLCRKQHGTLFGTGLGVAAERLRWLTGEHTVVHYRATAAFERPFCDQCGSAVPALSHEPGTWHVPAGLLAGDIGARPRSHIFVASKSSLHAITDALSQHAAYPPGIDLSAAELPKTAPAARGVSGSCLCGAVTFEAATPRRLVNCYCSLCRRRSGAGFASTLFAAAASFRWRSGQERVRRYALPAPRTYASDFCSTCGSPVPLVMAGSPLALLPAGAIDSPLPELRAVHLYVGSKAAWCAIRDANPRFAELPPPERFKEFFRDPTRHDACDSVPRTHYTPRSKRKGAGQEE